MYIKCFDSNSDQPSNFLTKLTLECSNAKRMQLMCLGFTSRYDNSLWEETFDTISACILWFQWG